MKLQPRQSVKFLEKSSPQNNNTQNKNHLEFISFGSVSSNELHYVNFVAFSSTYESTTYAI